MQCAHPLRRSFLLPQTRAVGKASVGSGWGRENGSCWGAAAPDPVHIARQVAKLLDAQSLRHELGAKGRANILAGMNWEVERERLLGAYETALSN